jgi:anti-sigma B factor antagonist
MPVSTLDHDRESVLQLVLAGGGECVSLRLSGELDLAGAADVESTIADACRVGCAALVVDLSELSYCDSAGIRALVNANNTCVDHGVQMRVVGVHGPVRRVFELIRADSIFAVDEMSRGGRIALPE